MPDKLPRNQLEQKIKELEAQIAEYQQMTSKALLESEERFRKIAETSSDMIHLNDEKGRIIFANPATESLLGYDIDDIINRPAAEFIHPDDREVVSRDMESVLTGNEIPFRDVRLLKKNGAYLEVEIKGFAVALEKKEKCIGAILRDATRRKEAEREIEKHQHNLEDLVKQRTEHLEELLVFSQNLTSTINLKSLYRKVTSISKKLLNLDFSTLLVLSDDKSRLVIEDTIGFPESTIGTFSLVKGQGLSTYVVQEKKHATVLHFNTETRFEVPPIVFEKKITSALCVPMIIDDEVFGVLIGHTCDRRIFMDEEISLYQSFANQAIVAIKNSVHFNSLNESEMKFRTLVDQAADAFFLVETDGKIVDVNQQACESLGYSREELLSMNVHDVDIEAEKLQHNKKLWNTLPLGQSITIKGVHQRKDGTTFPVEVLASRLQLGKHELLVGLARDITQRKKMEKELLRAQKLESVGVLAGGIAHDFNNLLTAILGNISLAKIYISSEDKAFAKLTESEKAIMRAKGLTQQLLTFSRGGEPIKQSAAVVEIIKDSTGFVLKGSKTCCKYLLADDLWLIKADEDQIGQVFQNLVINGSQAMPEGGTVEIKARNIEIGANDTPALPEGKYVKISVTDHGVGIPKEHIQKIFDPYFSTKQTGSGLGLATVYSIIRNHNGLITVESEIGVGTTFYIYLPVSEKTTPGRKEAKEKTVMGKGKILVMDDEELVQQVSGSILNHLGYETRFADDGLKAIDLYKKALEDGCPFDVVIMDLTIPGGMGGKETIKKLLEIDPAAKAIVSSGYANDPIMAEFSTYGFKAVIPKPYKIEALSEKLHHIIKEDLIRNSTFRLD